MRSRARDCGSGQETRRNDRRQGPGHQRHRVYQWGLARRLATHNAPAHAAPLADLGIEVVQGGLCDSRSLREAMRGIDLVYHVAAL